VTTHQEYLVKRLRELASGGAMSDYRWNGGSRTTLGGKGVEWTDNMPTDADIIMHW
jgi:hypothetical protein